MAISYENEMREVASMFVEDVELELAAVNRTYCDFTVVKVNGLEPAHRLQVSYYNHLVYTPSKGHEGFDGKLSVLDMGPRDYHNRYADASWAVPFANDDVLDSTRVLLNDRLYYAKDMKRVGEKVSIADMLAQAYAHTYPTGRHALAPIMSADKARERSAQALGLDVSVRDAVREVQEAKSEVVETVAEHISEYTYGAVKPRLSYEQAVQACGWEAVGTHLINSPWNAYEGVNSPWKSAYEAIANAEKLEERAACLVMAMSVWEDAVWLDEVDALERAFCGKASSGPDGMPVIFGELPVSGRLMVFEGGIKDTSHMFVCMDAEKCAERDYGDLMAILRECIAQHSGPGEWIAKGYDPEVTVWSGDIGLLEWAQEFEHYYTQNLDLEGEPGELASIVAGAVIDYRHEYEARVCAELSTTSLKVAELPLKGKLCVSDVAIGDYPDGRYEIVQVACDPYDRFRSKLSISDEPRELTELELSKKVLKYSKEQYPSFANMGQVTYLGTGDMMDRSEFSNRFGEALVDEGNIKAKDDLYWKLMSGSANIGYAQNSFSAETQKILDFKYFGYGPRAPHLSELWEDFGRKIDSLKAKVPMAEEELLNRWRLADARNSAAERKPGTLKNAGERPKQPREEKVTPGEDGKVCSASAAARGVDVVSHEVKRQK